MTQFIKENKGQKMCLLRVHIYPVNLREANFYNAQTIRTHTNKKRINRDCFHFVQIIFEIDSS